MRIFQIIVSALLAAVCLFVLVACGFGVQDALSIADYKTQERKDGLAAIDMLADGVGQLTDNEETYLAGVETYEEGLATYQAGQANYSSGLATYYAGKQQIDDNTQAYNDGKQQLEDYETIYNISKTLTDSYNESGLDLPITGKIMGLLEDKVITTYEDGQAQIKTYEDGLVQLQEGQVALASGAAQLAQGEQDLADGKAQLAVFEDGEQQVAEGVDTLIGLTQTIYRHNGKDVAVLGVAERLGDDYTCYTLDETGATAQKNGVDYLDFDACMLVAETGRQYIEDQTVDVTNEVLGRIIVTALAGIAALLGLIAAVLGIFGKTKAPMVLGIIAACMAIGANVVGMFTRYAGYTYPLKDGAYAGKLQLAAFILLALAAVTFMIVAIIVKARADKRRATAAAAAAADMAPSAQSVTLAERLDALEAENARLRIQLDAMTATHV